MLRFILGLFAALIISFPAHAAFPASQGYSYGPVGSGGGYPSLEAWGAAYGPPRLLTFTGCTGVWSNNTSYCNFNNSSGNPITPQQVQRYPQGLVCPAGATLSGSDCTCNSGYAQNGNACVASTADCPFGQGRTFNRTVGWARSPNADANDIVHFYGPPASNYDYNDGTCVGNLTGIDNCWRSQVPSAQGLYRLSCDHTMIVSGVSTSPGDVNADPDTDNATCPGFVGQVNGKTVCVGTASSPLPADQNAPDVPTGAGNPSAGPKPSTGPGSGDGGAGRTPLVGSGGNDGGPSGAAIGSGGTGPRSDGTDPTGEVCGASPLPPCNVKVDETGTPAANTADGLFSQGNTDLDKVKTDSEAAFNSHKDIQLPGWTWTFAFPTGCTPLILNAYSDLVIDVCQWQPIIHDLMSMLWVAAGIWGLIALFRNAAGV